MKTFEAEPQSSSILGLNWNVNTDSPIVCRGTDQEVPAKITQRIVLSFVSAVFDPFWDMLTRHNKNVVSTQKHLGSFETSMGQGFVSRTLKTVQWLLLWVERNKNDVDKSILFWKRLYKFETTHFHRRVRRSDVHRGISARRCNVGTHLSDRKMPCSTYQTYEDSKVRTSNRSLRSSTQEADFEGTWCQNWQNLPLDQFINSLTVVTVSSQKTKIVLPTGQQKYWKTLPWINADMSKASKTQQILVKEGCPSKASRSPCG